MPLIGCDKDSDCTNGNNCNTENKYCVCGKDQPACVGNSTCVSSTGKCCVPSCTEENKCADNGCGQKCPCPTGFKCNSNSECKKPFPTWGIALIVLASVVVCVAIIVGAVLGKKKHKM